MVIQGIPPRPEAIIIQHIQHPPGRCSSHGHIVFVHPNDFIDMVHALKGTDAALDELKKQLHGKIDRWLKLKK